MFTLSPGDALLRPQTLKTLPFTLNRLTISLQPSLEKFESQLLQLINADCQNTVRPSFHHPNLIVYADGHIRDGDIGNYFSWNTENHVSFSFKSIFSCRALQFEHSNCFCTPPMKTRKKMLPDILWSVILNYTHKAYAFSSSDLLVPLNAQYTRCLRVKNKSPYGFFLWRRMYDAYIQSRYPDIILLAVHQSAHIKDDQDGLDVPLPRLFSPAYFPLSLFPFL